MSLEQSSNGATTPSDNVDHLSEDRNHTTNTTQFNKTTESSRNKHNGDVYTKYKDWDLTKTEKNATNDNADDEMNDENIIGDVPDSLSVAMSIKRAFWPSENINQHMMSNFRGDFNISCKKALQTVLFIEKSLNKKNALVTLLNETKDCQGIIIYVRENGLANFIAAFLSELDYPSVSIQSDYEKPKQEKAMEDFKKKKVKILVTTLANLVEKDLLGVKMVVNYDLPNTREEYLQRIGRVGDSEIPDRVFSFFDPKCDSSNASYLLDILKKAGQQIPPFLPYYCIDDVQTVNESIAEDEEQAARPN